MPTNIALLRHSLCVNPRLAERVALFGTGVCLRRILADICACLAVRSHVREPGMVRIGCSPLYECLATCSAAVNVPCNCSGSCEPQGMRGAILHADVMAAVRCFLHNIQAWGPQRTPAL
jgi:hypothetical protein